MHCLGSAPDDNLFRTLWHDFEPPDPIGLPVNTPTHLMLSVAALTRRGEVGQSTYMAPAVIGAILPDAPMFGFYAIEKFVLGTAEREIWKTQYFLPGWQDFFDLFNSIPLVALGLLVTWQLGRKGLYVMFLSMMLHLACDLPVHHDDGHRHFWPLTDWRYASPVSYWDPNHFGRPAALAEIVLFTGCYIVSMVKHRTMGIRIGLTVVAAIHLGMFALFLFWIAM